MLVAVRRTGDRFGVVTLPISDEEVPVGFLETVSSQEFLAAESIEFLERPENGIGGGQISKRHPMSLSRLRG